MLGAILYEGPSMLDGAPIVVIATGFAKSRNEKTGAMLQTWILRSDMHPKDATSTGADASICGTCPHRGRIDDGRNVGRSCYVLVHNAPAQVYKSYKAGKYSRDWDAGTFAGKKVRLGSYGDPAAVPFHVWERVLSEAAGFTGYTHQWAVAPELAAWVMASCDSESDRVAAKMLGFRTFRVKGKDDPRMEREVICPASAEAGYKTNCATCQACGGNSAKAKADIVINAHGGTAIMGNYNRNRAAAIAA